MIDSWINQLDKLKIVCCIITRGCLAIVNYVDDRINTFQLVIQNYMYD